MRPKRFARQLPVAWLAAAALLAGSVAAPRAYQTATFQWEEGPVMPEILSNPAAFVLPDQRLLVVGRWQLNLTGNLNEARVPRAYILDTSTAAWSVKAAGDNIFMDYSAIQLADGRALLVGSSSVGGPTSITYGYVYDHVADRWRFASALNERRLRPMLARLNDGRILAAGGYKWIDSSTVVGSDGAEIYDPASPPSQPWTVVAAMATRRISGAAVTLNDGRVLVAGGHPCNSVCDPGVSSAALASAEIYDPVTDTWTLTGSMSAARMDHRLILLADGRVFAVGGTGPSSYLNSAEIFDPSSGTWTPVAPMARQRRGAHAMLTGDSMVLVTGGDYDPQGDITQYTAETYNPSTGTWTMANLMAPLRAHHAGVIRPDGRPMLFGGSNYRRTEIATQPRAACTGSISPASRTIASGAATGSISVTISPGCRWTATSDASWLTITSAAVGTTNATVTYRATANPSITTGRTGRITINSDVFTVVELPQPCTAVASPRTPTAAAAGGAVLLRISIPDGCAWTPTPNVPWITYAGPSHTGPADVVLNVAPNPSPTEFRQGTISIGFTVLIVTQASGISASPFGVVETPLQGATGVTGSIAVTGWTLDDLEVTRVRILRGTVPPEPQNQTVYIGDATLVEGARPDVAAAYPAYPYNTRAGWGYLLLTNFLPNLGNGTFTLYAYADDREGQSTLLGTRQITCTNSSATVPFGAIDTPAQGETVSGTIHNFGWVLASGATRADPPSGGRVTVLIDGVPVGEPTGWTSRSDLSALFPQAQFSGVGNALGVFTIDTTQLADGVHTIAWLVTDNAGGSSGIGSRYFTVLNGSSLVADARIARHEQPSIPHVVVDRVVPDLAGWAVDPASSAGTGIGAIHVWAYPVRGGSAIFLGTAAYGGARPDVAAIYGERFLASGYAMRLQGLSPGTYDLAVFPYSTVRGGFAPAKTARITITAR